MTLHPTRCFPSASRLSLCFFILLSHSAPNRAEDSPENRLTEAMVARIRQVSSAQVSPDGNLIAYTLSNPRPVYAEEDGAAWSELHVVDMGGHSRPFVTGKVNVSSVSWVPGGRSIAFLAQRGEDEHKSLYIIPVDGGEAKKVLDHETEIIAYAWAPDSKRVAFTAKAKEEKDLEENREHGFDADIYEEGLRSVQVWIAPCDPQAAVLDPDESNEAHLLPLKGSASSIEWSPDGRHLAVALAPTPLVDDRYMRRRIHIVDVQSGQSRCQLDTRGKLGEMAWSPDGQRLALVAGVDEHDPREGHLMVGTVDDPVVRDLLPDYPGHIWSLAWKDSRTIMYLGYQGVWSTFAQVDAEDGSASTILAKGKYTLHELSLSQGGSGIAFIGESPLHPGEVYAMRPGETKPRRLTHSNPFLEGVPLARQEVVTFEARDGLALEGILIRPLEEKAGSRYPLIMMVHGGPEAHHVNGWLTRYSLPGQVAAAQGFASFYTNYRGSTGRGVPFSKLSQGDPGGKEFDDLIDAVDHLVASGLVDKDRVGITGGSYGGYASAWGATYFSHRYAASVMFVGISDQFLSFALGDIPEEHRLVHHMKHPWEQRELLRQRSPITHFRNCRTPLLILHGTKDTRVHPAQSLALYRAIKTYGKSPVRLVHYPGEPHGNRRTGSRLDFSLRLMRWMNHYLKGSGGEPPPHLLDLADIKPEEESSQDP
ncbi:MAG: S9 family peptidase [Planctomycetes bacterium]|nr:S9 family peptidase [Planctomycetota bacterium]